MAWTINSWSSATRSGEIRSPHFDAVWFGPCAAPDDAEFAVDEEVVATLDGEPGEYTVTAVRKVRSRAADQPPGTEDAVFSWVNTKRFGDLRVDESSTSDNLALWVGDCCQWCSEAALIVFRSTTRVQGMDEDGDWDDPYFRRATDQELNGATVPSEHHAYFIVLSAYKPEGNAGLLVIARTVHVDKRPCRHA